MDYLMSLSPFLIVCLVTTFNWLMTFLGASLVFLLKRQVIKLSALP